MISYILKDIMRKTMKKDRSIEAYYQMQMKRSLYKIKRKLSRLK